MKRNWEKDERSSHYLKKIVATGLATSVLTACSHEALADNIPNNSSQTVTTEITKSPEAIVEQLQDSWEQAMNQRDGQVAIAVYDLRSNQTAHWETPGSDTFATASIVKYSILVEALRQCQERSETLDGYNLEEATIMIQQSDNAAAEYLWNQVGGTSMMQNLFDTLNMKNTEAMPSWGVTKTTALDQLEILKQLTSLSTTLNASSIAQMNTILDGVEADQHWGVSSSVPANTTIRLKNGWLDDSSTGNEYANTSSWTVNSIGNVDSLYLIAILSEGNPVGSDRAEAPGVERLETLSRLTWEIISH